MHNLGIGQAHDRANRLAHERHRMNYLFGGEVTVGDTGTAVAGPWALLR